MDTNESNKTTPAEGSSADERPNDMLEDINNSNKLDIEQSKINSELEDVQIENSSKTAAEVPVKSESATPNEDTTSEETPDQTATDPTYVEDKELANVETGTSESKAVESEEAAAAGPSHVTPKLPDLSAASSFIYQLKRISFKGV